VKRPEQLREIMSEFQQEKDFVNLSRFIDMSAGTTIQGHDIRPMQKEFERQLLQIVGAKMKKKPNE
jgi:predicted TPR repeat methyltransferase